MQDRSGTKPTPAGGRARAEPRNSGGPPEAVQRTNNIMVRLTDDEMARFEARMVAGGARQRGPFARSVLLGEGARPVGDPRTRRTVPALNIGYWARLQGLASTLGDIALHLDAGHILGPAATGDLQERLAELDTSLRRTRLALLGIEAER